MGRYRDFELTFNSYGRRFGFDVIHQWAGKFLGMTPEGEPAP